MEKFRNSLFSLADIREIKIVSYLEKLGYEPEKIRKNGTDYWYLSPLRNENEASFHVNDHTNQWYDFSLAAGGNLVDFCLRYHGCSSLELLEKFNANLSLQHLPLFDADLHEGRAGKESKLVVTDVRPLYTYPLKNYLQSRSIPLAVAELFCAEVSYQIADHAYYGIGFKNDAGGYEIRSKNYKQSSSPKDITTLCFGAGAVQVFEGFFDFLSYHVLHPEMKQGGTDFVVLNGAGMFDRALPFLERYETVGLWLDRDVTGKAYTQHALSLGTRYKDESALYDPHKDLNEWLVNKGQAQKPSLKPP